MFNLSKSKIYFKASVILLMIVTLLFLGISNPSQADTKWTKMKKESDKEFEKVFKDKQNVYSKAKGSLRTATLSRANQNYPQRKGVILTTPDNDNKLAGIFKLGHAGIIYSSKITVEATAKGVREYNNDWDKRKDSHNKAIRVLGGDVIKTDINQEAHVGNWCYKKIGCHYNYSFWNTATRKKFYCSHLVWAGYKDSYRVNLNTSKYDYYSKIAHKMYVAVAPCELLSQENINKKKVRIIYKKVR